MKLSANFSLAEMTKSQTATRKGIKNEPSTAHVENLIHLAETGDCPATCQRTLWQSGRYIFRLS